jgi:uncharacterized protein YgbK (DUF1537 family)
MYLGCIGDDFTGSSDLGNTLAKAGMRVVQYSGVPDAPADADVQAGIVALKSRSLPVEEAVRHSLDALAWLQAQGCQQILFKYCSTFDSTPQGNIGPVAVALADALDARQVIFCPAFPTTGRSVFQGHLFVKDQLLSNSSLKDHPLNPMTESDLRRWLSLQTGQPVGHVPAETVFKGAAAVKQALSDEDEAGRREIIVDAITDSDLLDIGRAVAGLPLLTGGSGVAVGLPANFEGIELVSDQASHWQGQTGLTVAVSGSCAQATRDQIALHKESHPTLQLDSAAVISGARTVAQAADWAQQCLRKDQSAIPLIYSAVDPEQLKQIQARFGQQTAAEAFEVFFAALAGRLVNGGITRLIVAGGETSGAVIDGLKLGQLAIGPEIDPGVPALRARPDLVIALKSGNFGAAEFFVKAAARLAGLHEATKQVNRT